MYLRLVQKQNIEANRQVVNFAPVPLNLPLAKSFIIVRRWAKDVFWRQQRAIAPLFHVGSFQALTLR
jgi:hypothetical protein